MTNRKNDKFDHHRRGIQDASAPANADRDALNQHVAEAQGTAEPDDGSVTMGQLGIGNEFTIRPGALTTYLAVSVAPMDRLIVAHNITPGADFPTVLHIPMSQKVWPSLPVPAKPATPEPPKVIVPTVGRKVWFTPSGSWPAGMEVFPSSDYDAGLQQPLDATIVYVHHDRLVNLLVVDHAGNQFAVKSVQLVQPGDQACAAGHRAEWMPYQVKTAGKA